MKPTDQSLPAVRSTGLERVRLYIRVTDAVRDPGKVLGRVRRDEESLANWTADAVVEVLKAEGYVLDGVPPVAQVLADARQFSDELVLTKLVARFFRVMILGAVIIPETPAAMEWLRDYIDGNHTVHGPLGKPMLWPGRLPAVCDLLRSWGFQPTPTNPQYVSLKPGGIMAPIDMPDPERPDPRSVPPIPEGMEERMGAILDGLTDGVSCSAIDRTTALRAMVAAYEAGRTERLN